MSVRQYIGARYTIKVYENSVDPSTAEWQSGVAYEPITLVTYNSSSYLSKKNVPASVGNPASNPSYWVCTGYYNGQIITLQNEIDAIENIIDQLALDDKPFSSNCDVMFIGDSWGVSSHYYNVDINSVMNFNHYYQSCYNGSGFYATGIPQPDDKNYKKLLDTLCSSLTADERAAVNYLIVEGDINDTNDYAYIETYCKDFIDEAVTLLPNAKIYIFAVNHAINGLWGRFTYVAELMKCNGYKGAVVGDLTWCMGNNEWLNSTHLTQEGYKRVTDAIICAMKGVPYGFTETVKTIAFANSTYNVSVNFQFYMRNNQAYVYIPSFQITSPAVDLTSPVTITLTPDSDLYPFVSYSTLLVPGYMYRGGHADRDSITWRFIMQPDGTINITIPPLAGTSNELVFLGGELQIMY